MQAAVVLVAMAMAYIVYMVRAGLGRRVQLDKVRLRGLFGRAAGSAPSSPSCTGSSL